MLDHVSLGVRDLARSMAFYDAVLGALGQARIWTYESAAGYGLAGTQNDKLALFARGDDARAAGAGTHLALTATSDGAVEAAHAAALQHGGSDEGAPGQRPKYGPGYFAGFVRDPDGHKLELVHHG